MLINTRQAETRIDYKTGGIAVFMGRERQPRTILHRGLVQRTDLNTSFNLLITIILIDFDTQDVTLGVA